MEITVYFVQGILAESLKLWSRFVGKIFLAFVQKFQKFQSNLKFQGSL